MDEDHCVTSLEKIFGGGGPSLAGAEIVDVAHASLLEGHRGAAGGDADHSDGPSSGPGGTGVTGDERVDVGGDGVTVAEGRRGTEEGRRFVLRAPGWIHGQHDMALLCLVSPISLL